MPRAPVRRPAATRSGYRSSIAPGEPSTRHPLEDERVLAPAIALESGLAMEVAAVHLDHQPVSAGTGCPRRRCLAPMLSGTFPRQPWIPASRSSRWSRRSAADHGSSLDSRSNLPPHLVARLLADQGHGRVQIGQRRLASSEHLVDSVSADVATQVERGQRRHGDPDSRRLPSTSRQEPGSGGRRRNPACGADTLVRHDRLHRLDLQPRPEGEPGRRPAHQDGVRVVHAGAASALTSGNSR